MKRPDPSEVVDFARMAMAAAGVALFGYGAWLVFKPAGFIVVGILLFGTALIGTLRSDRR